MFYKFLNVYHLILSKIIESTTVHQLCMEIITKFEVIEYEITMSLFLIISVTFARAIRSFSKLKIIKNYLRNSIEQNRLRHLSLITIENKTASKLDLS